MSIRQIVTLVLLLGTCVGATWEVARGTSDGREGGQGEVYSPTTEEWLQVWTNANFGRNDGRRTIQFIVPPGRKTIMMATLVTVNEEANRGDPMLRQKLSMEADSFEAQVKAYAQRFGFTVQRQDLLGG